MHIQYTNEFAQFNYQSYGRSTFRTIEHLKGVNSHLLSDIEAVSVILPFKTNSYVINELIDWTKVPDDPMFILTFPQKEMLQPAHFSRIKKLIIKGADKDELRTAANEIRMELNPHPAGQIQNNIPEIDGVKLTGMQHKYRETVLFFPSQGQTCHAYCTFCFRWPQFTGMDELKFAMRETDLLVKYMRQHPEVTDVLFTGGDPLIMKTKILSGYIDALLNAKIPNLQSIRIGTKALSWWPYRFITDEDSEDLIRLFEKIIQQGLNLAIMAHFNHPVELSTEAVKIAVRRIRSTGAQIRTQSPVLRHVNDDPALWAQMWRRQVNLNCIPYYMFIARDTGAQQYFAVPLVKAWELFRNAYQNVSGICRTVRGPSMSCTPGKIQVLGVSEIPDEINTKKVIVMRMLQGRDPDWVARPFFAEYNKDAVWFDELKPAFGEDCFFFEKALEERFKIHCTDFEAVNFE